MSPRYGPPYHCQQRRVSYHLATKPRFVSEVNYNVAPRQWLPVIVEDPDKGRIVKPMQWGFLPPWSNDPSKGMRPINTKSEGVFDSLDIGVLRNAEHFVQITWLGHDPNLPYCSAAL